MSNLIAITVVIALTGVTMVIGVFVLSSEIHEHKKKINELDASVDALRDKVFGLSNGVKALVEEIKEEKSNG